MPLFARPCDPRTANCDLRSRYNLCRTEPTMLARGASLSAILLLFSIGVLAAPPHQAGEHPTATVLCYHIVETPAAPRMHIDRETFRQHLRYLEMTGYNVIPLRHLYEYVAGTRDSLPKNAIV